MLIKKSIAILLAMIPSLALSQVPQQAFIAPDAIKSLLLDMTKTQSVCVAVGERGHILVGDAKCQGWKQVNVPSLATLTAVDFVGQQGWVVGHDATILASQDGGSTWSVQYFAPELEKPLLDVLFFDAQHGIAVGAYGTFLRTLDGGATWSVELHAELLSQDDRDYLADIKQEDEALYVQELSGILPHFNRVSFDGDKVFLAGEAGLLAVSNDMGKSWQRMEVDYIGSFFDIKRNLAGQVIAVGLRGNVFVLDPESQEWNALQTNISFTLNSIVLLNENRTLVVGNNGAMLDISADTIAFKQTDDGKALINAVVVDGDIVAVSEVGLKTLDKKVVASE